MVCLNAKADKGNRLTRMLGVLLSPRMKVTDKIIQLENEYEIPMENEMGKEMNEMCNLSDYVEELGIQKGKDQLLTSLIEKKLLKGMSVREIADDLEESEEKVREIIDAVRTDVKDNQ